MFEWPRPLVDWLTRLTPALLYAWCNWIWCELLVDLLLLIKSEQHYYNDLYNNIRV